MALSNVYRLSVHNDAEFVHDEANRSSFHNGLKCFVHRETLISIMKQFHGNRIEESGPVLLSVKKKPSPSDQSFSFGVLVKVAALPISEHGAGVGVYNEPSQVIESPVTREVSPMLLPEHNVIYSSPKFLWRLKQLYPQEIDEDVEVIGTPVRSSTVHLDQIVLMPTTEKGFYNEGQVDEKFKGVLRNDVQVLSRGTVFTMKLTDLTVEYQVLDCFPYNQGILTKQTIVIMVEPSLPKPKPMNGMLSPSPKENGIHTKRIEPLMMSSLLLPQIKLSDPSLQQKHDALQYNFKVFPIDFWRTHRLEDNSPSDQVTDIGVTLNTLKRLHIYHGGWVVITAQPNGPSHLGRAIALEMLARSKPFEYADNAVYISSTMEFNLKLTQSSKVTLEEYTKPILTASQVTISRIRSPFSDGTTSYVKPLRNYFKIARLISKDDIISIPILKPSDIMPEDEDESNTQDETDNLVDLDEHVKEYVHFKVVQAVSKDPNAISMWINATETALSQEGALSSRIPRSISMNESLPALSKHCKALSSMLIPSLHWRSVALGIKSPTVLLRGPKGCGKASVVHHVAKQLGVHLLEVNCYDMLGQIESQTDSEVRKLFEKANGYAPCILLLRNLNALEKTAQAHNQQEPRSIISNTFKDCISTYMNGKVIPDVTETYEPSPLLVVGTVAEIDQVSGPLRGCFRHEVIFESPDETQRREYLTSITKHLPLGPTVSVRELAMQTASLSFRDLDTVLTAASIHATTRINDKIKLLSDDSAERIELAKEITSVGYTISWTDIENALSGLKSDQSSAIGAPKIPKVSWDDVGGLAHAKREILDTVQLPLQQAEYFGEGMRTRSGVLLYGPPGTGKTLLAKAVATECSLNFLSVKGPELINMYVGESEKNVRDLFQKARAAKPCVIFFDELDSLAPNRGKGADSGGVMDRIVSQLLAELDGLQKSAELFVIGATNRPDLIDPALLRPGRFDRLVYLGISEEHQSQLKIVKALTRKFNLAPSVSLEQVVEKCPLRLTGADFYALCSDALLTAITDRIEQLEELSKSDPEKVPALSNSPIQVEQQHFMRALDRLTPSVSEEELKHYKRLQAQFNSTKKET